ncbi:hypothetical protein Xoosp13_234 [Xanthomonas phage Xoo-sp13]|nr:hypothetical protein Xoosp13_234 [Xanthomonas phage Xoo-sp13]
MSRKVKSVRGEIVDFDLMDIKNRIMNAPTPDTVTQRERFIDKKRRRGSRKKADEILAKQQTNEASVRAAMEEDRRRRASDVAMQKEAQPHEVLPETVIVAEGQPKRRIVKGTV